MAILIVDDEPDARESLQVLLEAHGYTGVRTAGSAPAAVEQLSQPVELIVTDVSMPGLSGIEFCRHVKTTPHLQDIPVLVMTGYVSEDILEQAFAAGAHDFVPKGVRPTELLARVRSALNLKRELEARRGRERELVEATRRLARLNEKLRRISVRDELTGVPNRRYFNRMLHQEWARAAREAHPLALLMVDVDSFKGFNDRYGHPAGDVCLAQVASTLTGMVRRSGDIVARYGGEEFAVLLVNTGFDGAAAVAEGLRAAVEELNLPHADSPFGRVTISVGAAARTPEPGESSRGLLLEADQALYRAKATGRNRVQLADDNRTALPGCSR